MKLGSLGHGCARGAGGKGRGQVRYDELHQINWATNKDPRGSVMHERHGSSKVRPFRRENMVNFPTNTPATTRRRVTEMNYTHPEMRPTSFSSSYDEKASQQPAAILLRNTTMTPAGRTIASRRRLPGPGASGALSWPVKFCILSNSASLGN